MEKEKYITTSEFAKLLGISRVASLKRIKKMAKEGKIKIAEFGKSFVVEKASLPADIKNRIMNQQKEAAKRVIKIGEKPGKDLDFEKEL